MNRYLTSQKLPFQYFSTLAVVFFLFSAAPLLQAQSNDWALVMSKNSGWGTQVWRTRTYFPETEIKELWDQRYRITHLSYGNGTWALVMANGTKMTEQAWRTRKNFPKDEIKELWDKSYRITSLAYGNGLWGLVMTQKSGYTEQAWRTRVHFPNKEIQELWDEGYYVTSLTYGEGMWAVVGSKGTGWTDQVWRTRSYYPKDEIKELWDQGYSITTLTYGDGVWALVMTKGSTLGLQAWRSRSYFPEEEIKDLWDKGYHITSIEYGVYSAKPESTPTVSTNPQPVTPTPTTPTTPATVNYGPVVTVQSPGNGSSTTQKIVRLQGKATDTDGVFEVLVNGIEASLTADGTFFLDLPLAIGENSVQIRAKDVKMKESIYTLTVNRTASAQPVAVHREPDVDEDIPRTATPNRDAIAVVIGNKNYKNPDVPTVDFAIRDAQVMKMYLVQAFGFDDNNIIYLEDATQASFNSIFGNESNHKARLFNLVKPGQSDVFIFYSGHGAPEPETKNGFFVPVDCDPSLVAFNGYALSTFYKNLAQIPYRNLTVLIDACFSGSSGGGMLLHNISPVFIRTEDKVLNSPNSMVFTSAAGDQVSSWYPDKKHSLFTYYFMKGLKGEADTNQDKTITHGEMTRYLSEQVTYMARRLNNREQTPITYGQDSKVLFRMPR
jgi:regulator of replication initiation timing